MPEPTTHRLVPLPPLPPLPRAATRQQVLHRRAAGLSLSIAWLGVALFVMGLRADHRELSWPYVFGQPLLWSAVAAGLMSLATTGGSLGLGTARSRIRFAAVLVPALFALSCLWVESGPSSRTLAFSASAHLNLLGCGLSTFVLGAIPLAAALFGLRGAFVLNGDWRGALVGAGCGLTGAAAMHLHCAVASGWHLLVAHALPVVGLSIAGALAGRAWLRP